MRNVCPFACMRYLRSITLLQCDPVLRSKVIICIHPPVDSLCMYSTAIPACLVYSALEARTISDSRSNLRKRLGHRIMHDAQLVAHSTPERRAPLSNGQVRIIHIRQTHSVRAEIDIEERLFRLVRIIPRICDARIEALEDVVARMERQHARVELELEPRRPVYVRHSGEWERELEEFIKVPTHKRVCVQVHHALHVHQRPQTQFRVLVDEAASDTCAVVRGQDQLDFLQFPTRRAQNAERTRGEAARDVEEYASGRGARFLD